MYSTAFPELNLDAPPVGLFNTKNNLLIPIKYVYIEVKIQDNFAKVTMEHYYENLYNQPIDTEFKFPKTKEAIFDSLKATLDDENEIIAEVLSNKEGNQKFKIAKKKGDLAILTNINKATPDVIKTKIGNILPNQKVKVTFSYVTKLDISLDKNYQFRFPNIFIPRYVSNVFEDNFSSQTDILDKIKFLSLEDIKLVQNNYTTCCIQKPIKPIPDFVQNNEFIQYNSGEGCLYPWNMNIILNTTFKFSNLKYNNYQKNQNEQELFNVNINQNNKEAILSSNLINFEYPNQDVLISFEDIEDFKKPKIIFNQHPF